MQRKQPIPGWTYLNGEALTKITLELLYEGRKACPETKTGL